MKLKKWIKQYAKIVATRGLAASTAEEKVRYAWLLCRSIGGKRRLCDVRPVHIARAVAATWQDGEQAKARRVLSVARDLFAEAIWHGHAAINPALHIKPRAYRIRRARLSLPQWRAVQSKLETEAAPWRRLLAVLALVTGQRRSDLVKLRFADVWGGHLHIEQAKTGERIALPLKLRLQAIGVSLGEVIGQCRAYSPPGDTLLRKSTGRPLAACSLTLTFRAAFRSAVKWERNDSTEPSLAEIRSLSARLYLAQGLDTQTLLGHRKAATTAIYHDSRGLDKEDGRWRCLKLPRREK